MSRTPPSRTLVHPTPSKLTTVPRRPALDELVALGWEMNANQHRAVHLAARYDEEMDWFHRGLKNAAHGISLELQIHSSTASEWIRVGHSLRHLPLIDAAFASNDISYAKARILTRWADSDNEAELLALAKDRSANRLTAAIAKAVAVDDTDDERDERHYEYRGCTSYTRGDGMIVVNMVLEPAIGKPFLAVVDDVVRQIAQTPIEVTGSGEESSADDSRVQSVSAGSTPVTGSSEESSADDSSLQGVNPVPLADTLRELRQRWQPGADDDRYFPTRAQQRADAVVALFLRMDIALTTEVVIHVRGDGNTFDDGTPITTNAVTRQLDQSFVRFMIHDSHRRPIDATNRRRFPTPRQKHVVLETHNHECVDCQTTDLLEFDHNPPFEQTRHTVTTELQPRCTECHRARHRAGATSWAA